MSARRDYCKYAKNVYTTVIDMIARGDSKDDIANYVDYKVICLYSGNCDVSDLIITKSLARDLSLYKVNQPHVVLAKRLSQETGINVTAGTRLEYVFVKGPGTQGEKMRTLDEVERDCLEIDGMFYVKKQLITQVDDILSVIGLDNYIKSMF
jgi:DNA polymerase elongation subunit (family B)